MMVGVGYRHALAAWISQKPRDIQCLEITAEHFFCGGENRLRELRQTFPLFVHGLGLSLGTPGPLDTGVLADFERVVRAADPLWISEHVAFTRTSEVDLGHLNPITPSRTTLRVMVDHARELADRCGKPLILENITTHLRLTGELSEPEFLSELCREADCGLLLDVTNLFINSRNHDFDPVGWLDQLNCSRIVQLHIVGYSVREERYVDGHSDPVQQELLDLLREVVRRAPVRAVILERDHDFPRPEILAQELSVIRDAARASDLPASNGSRPAEGRASAHAH